MDLLLKIGVDTMILKTEAELKYLIEADSWMMEIVAAVERLELPDSWICAGFIFIQQKTPTSTE
ncbi:hypothetical protein [Lysinibacillus sp. NPDC047702]|uniref:hypothetical protein n=1 Tax=unclassified Lysinibacillus TaxID=2636778 RepID=UPI003D0858B4